MTDLGLRICLVPIGCLVYSAAIWWSSPTGSPPPGCRGCGFLGMQQRMSEDRKVERRQSVRKVRQGWHEQGRPTDEARPARHRSSCSGCGADATESSVPGSDRSQTAELSHRVHRKWVLVLVELHVIVIVVSVSVVTRQRLTRLTIAHQNRNGDTTRGRKWSEIESPLLPRLLQLVSMVLKPDLDLRWTESQYARQMFPLGCRQVALLAEPTFQFVSLSLRKQHPPVSFCFDCRSMKTVRQSPDWRHRRRHHRRQRNVPRRRHCNWCRIEVCRDVGCRRHLGRRRPTSDHRPAVARWRRRVDENRKSGIHDRPSSGCCRWRHPSGECRTLSGVDVGRRASPDMRAASSTGVAGWRLKLEYRI